MDTALIVPAFKTPRAVLACLAMVLLLGNARAEEALAPVAAGFQPVTSPGQPPEASTSLEIQPSEQDPSLLGSSIAPPEKVIVETEAWPETIEWVSDEGPQESFRNRIGRCFPLGMIPYFGPRTPDDQKDRGIGVPIIGNGWRSQPFSIAAFSGVTDGGALIPGRVNQRPSYYGGINIGWDYDHYWGIEKRLGFGALNLANGNNQPISTTGLSVTGEYRLMYYPLGDTRWRPFVTAGVGWSDFYFNDDRGVSHLDTVGMIPFGFGLKYLYSDRIAFRTDLIDEMTFGNGLLANFQYVAFTAGLEFRYGRRLLHMPWHRNDGS